MDGLWPACEIRFRRIERPTYLAERALHDVLVDDRPDHHAQIDVPALQVWRAIGADDLQGDLGMIETKLRECLREQACECLRNGQADTFALRYGRFSRCRHRPFHFQRERQQALTEWRKREPLGPTQHERPTYSALQCR